MTECPSCHVIHDYRPKFCESCGYQFASDVKANIAPSGPPARTVKALILTALSIIGLLVAFGIFGGGQPENVQSGSPAPKTAVAADSGMSAQPGPAPQSDSSSAVQGWSANRLLAQQDEKHRETIEAMQGAKSRGDYDGVIRILRIRSAELTAAIENVNTGSYSIDDKQKMLKVLEQEQAWADASAAFLASPIKQH